MEERVNAACISVMWRITHPWEGKAATIVTICVDLEGVMLSEVSHTEKESTVWSCLHVESERIKLTEAEWNVVAKGRDCGKRGDIGQRAQTPSGKISKSWG